VPRGAARVRRNTVTRPLAFGAAVVALSIAGCGGGGKSGQDALARKLADRLGCSRSYVAGSTASPFVGTCVFRGLRISILTFQNDLARNSYICSNCGFDAATDARTVENTAHRLGGTFVAGSHYLVRVPNTQTELAVKAALRRASS
jgi:hypothetical protein